jgi:multidrug resistance efflux pump
MTQPATAESSGLMIRTLALAGLALGGGVWLTRHLDGESTQTYSGRLQARIYTVAAERPARLKEVAVKPGQRVAAGETLLVLEGEPEHDRRDAAQRELCHREQEAQRIRAAAELEIHWRRKELQAEIFQTRLRLAALRQEKLHLDVAQLAWQEQLSVSDVFTDQEREGPLVSFVSRLSTDISEGRLRAMLQEDAAAGAAQALAAQIVLCEERLAELQALDAGLETQVRTSHGVAFAEEQVRLAAERLRQAETAVATATVVSPGYGIIGVFRRQPGEVVQGGEVMVQILDDDRRTIEFDVPSREVVKFAPGQQVRLDFPGKQARTGVISSISPQASASGDSGDDVPVKLVIEPSGKLWPAAPIGSRVLVYKP